MKNLQDLKFFGEGLFFMYIANIVLGMLDCITVTANFPLSKVVVLLLASLIIWTVIYAAKELIYLAGAYLVAESESLIALWFVAIFLGWALPEVAMYLLTKQWILFPDDASRIVIGVVYGLFTAFALKLKVGE